MVFNTTISVSDLILGLTTLLGGYAAFLAVRSTVITQGTTIARIEVEMRKQTDILIAIARQDERINSLESRFRDAHQTVA